MEYLIQESRTTLIIVDDMMENVCKRPEILTSLYTRKVHHRNLACVTLLQALYPKNMRVISLNSTAICLFKQIRNADSVSYLARQIFPMNPRYFMESYENAVSRKYGYLTVELHPNADDRFRLRNSLFVTPEMKVYLRHGTSINP